MKRRIWSIMSTSKLESKLHDLAMLKKKAFKGEKYRFYGIRCHGNEINTCDLLETKV